MTTPEFIQQIQNKIISGNLADAARLLVKFLEQRSSGQKDNAQDRLHHQALHQLSQLNELKHQELTGTLRQEDADLKRNKIRSALLEITKTLRDKEKVAVAPISDLTHPKPKSTVPNRKVFYGLLILIGVLVVIVFAWKNVINQNPADPPTLVTGEGVTNTSIDEVKNRPQQPKQSLEDKVSPAAASPSPKSTKVVPDKAIVGIGDFNGDGKSDVFVLQGNKWKVSDGGTDSLRVINNSNHPIENLRFGDFNGYGKTDVFVWQDKRWKVSDSGTEKLREINKIVSTLENLRFGDFNGDGKTDVFVWLDKRWKISDSGTEKLREINKIVSTLENLRFGDFNGDGKTDVFVWQDKRWKVSDSGMEKLREINKIVSTLENLRFGDFNGDGKTDVFVWQDKRWKVSFSGTEKLRVINKSTYPIENLWFGDFDGDGKTDVLVTDTAGWKVYYSGTEALEPIE